MTTFTKTKSVATTRRMLKAVGDRGNFAVNGRFVPPGAIVEIGSCEGAELLARGLAVDATAAEVTAAGANVIVAPSRNEKWADAA